MIQVNLLPHRQIRRAEKQREFTLMMLMVAILAAAVIFVGWNYIVSRIDEQNERNSRLDREIGSQGKDIEAIKVLRQKIDEVLDRKLIVEELQANRSQAVIVMEELARRLPEGVQLKSIKQQEKSITIEGVVDANVRIATYVHELAESKWLESPNLLEIKNSTVDNVKLNQFILTVDIKQQVIEPEGKKTGKNKGGA